MRESESQRPGEIYNVFVYPYNESTVGFLRAAKAQMTVDYQIVPKASEAGAGGRTIAFGKVPWIVTDGIAQIGVPENLNGVAAAIHWAATGEFDSRVSTPEQQLSKIFGKPVTEISDDQLKLENISHALDLDNKKRVQFR